MVVSRQDANWGSVGDQLPDFVHGLIGDRDAAVGPVQTDVGERQVAGVVGQTVDHDVAAGVQAPGLGEFPVPGAGIGDAAAGLAMARTDNSTRAMEENTRSNREMVRAMEGVINRDIVLL